MKSFEFAKGLPLPTDAVTQTFAFIARKGAGKTYAAGKVIEGLDAIKAQFVVLTPLPNWWGLRLAADGKGDGLDIVILGGIRGDIPLDANAGALVANAIIDSGRNFIIDVSQFSLGERKRFVTAFGEQLWQRQKAVEDPNPVHVVLEEAQLFLPQNIVKGDEHMVGIWNEIVRLGRNCGVGVSLITQRPQSVAKEALTQAECLIVGQVNGVPEKKALREWIVEKGAQTELLDELPFLEQGVVYIWSPQWLQHFGKHKVLPKWTFDSTSTPKAGVKPKAPKLKSLDLDALKQQMSETVKKLQENDPVALKMRIRELESEVKSSGHGLVHPDEIRKAQVESSKRVEELREAALEALNAVNGAANRAHADAVKGLKTFMPSKLNGHTPRASGAHDTVLSASTRFVTERSPVASQRRVETKAESSASAEGSINKGEKAILTAIAQHGIGCTREQLSVLTGYKKSSRDTYLQKLQSGGFIERHGDIVVATHAGIEALGDFTPLPTGVALRDHWMARLPEGERRILEVVVRAFPSSVERESIDEVTGYKKSSRDTYLQKLSARKLVVSSGRGAVVASDTLFN